MELKRYKPNKIIYRVKPSDTKEMIASKFNASVLDVVCLTSNDCCEGAFVEIKNSFDNLYVVKPLDNLEQIATKFNVSVATIKETNNLKDDRLFVGQRLRF